MKTQHRKTAVRLAAAVLSLLLLAACFFGCGKKNLGKTLFTVEGETFSVNMYELLLARMRAVLEQSGGAVDEDSFWRTVVNVDGKNMTYEEYYRASVLENCKTYVVAAYLFDKFGLTLSADATDRVEHDIELLIDTDADGSESGFNKILSAYGANIDILREVYLTEEKIKAVETYLYGASGELISDSVKDAYVAEHFTRFKQVLLTTYYYVYETDKNGDTIYYYSSGDKKDHVYYDKENGKPDAAETKDEKGDVIYYTEDGKIAYNTEKGTPAYKTDKDGKYVVEYYDKDQLEELKKKAEGFATSVAAGDYAAFEKLMTENNDKEDAQTRYTEGYYLSKTDSYTGTSAYIGTIIKQLATMQDGECALVESDYGYHVIMKYPVESGAYNKTANEDFFTDLISDITEALFLEECAKYMDKVVTDETVLASARSIKDLPSNRYY